VDGRAARRQRGGVGCLFLRCAVGVWALLLAGGPARGADPAAAPAAVAGREWKHPAAWAPPAIMRWFADLPAELRYSEARVRRGDDPAWAQPEWDDSGWDVTGVWELPARAGIDWVRFRVKLEPAGANPLPAGILVSTVRAYELFWDGVKLGQSGVPGNSAAEEKPGRVDERFTVPAALLGPGEHTVALRTSSHRCGFPQPVSGFRLLVGEPAALQRKTLREAFVPTVAAGALCMAGLASLMMWGLAARRATLLLLGAVCAAGAAMQGLQAMRWFFTYPADRHHAVLAAMTGLVGVQAALTAGLVTVQFGVPRGRLLLGALVAVLALVAWWSPARMNLDGARLPGLALAAALAGAGWAVWRGRRGAWPAALGLAASGCALALETGDYRASFFLKFLPALLGVIAGLALQLHDERRQAQEAKRAAARLETELLKKNLQPHFLLNTLAVLTEIVEQDPRSAVRLIDDLAGEFRAVARVSGEKTIPLGQELELCRAHLRVMSVRTGRTWTLEATGVDESAPVPPAVLLTLVENGFAHQRPEGPGPGVFRLTQERADGGGSRWVLVSPGRVIPKAGRPPGGTGLRYVRARLEEGFPGRWTLADGPVAEGWRTVIEIR